MTGRPRMESIPKSNVYNEEAAEDIQKKSAITKQRERERSPHKRKKKKKGNNRRKIN
jgi:hypothetical protein